MATEQLQTEHDYIDSWVDSPREIIEAAGIEEGTEVIATGMPRARHIGHRENEASSTDRLVSNIFSQYGDKADVKAYEESNGFEVRRAEGRPQWEFPSAREERNENLVVVVEGSDPSVMENFARDPEVHIFAGAVSYTGHELGMENRQSSGKYGRVDEMLSEDFGADTGIVTVENVPYFHDFVSDERDEADFGEYVTTVAEQVDDLYNTVTVVGTSRDPSELAPDQKPEMVYIMGEGRK